MAILEGLPSGVLNMCQKMFEISINFVVFRLKIANQMNLCLKNVKNVIYWACRGVSFWLKIVSRNCPNNEFFALKMSVFRQEKFKFLKKLSKFLNFGFSNVSFFVQKIENQGNLSKIVRK